MMHSRISPCNVPCPYKRTFETHAVKSLQACDSDKTVSCHLGEQGDGKISIPESKLVDALKDLYLGCNWQGKGQNIEEDGNHTFLENLYKNIHIDVQEDGDPFRSPEGPSPWLQCGICKLKYLDNSVPIHMRCTSAPSSMNMTEHSTVDCKKTCSRPHSTSGTRSGATSDQNTKSLIKIQTMKKRPAYESPTPRKNKMQTRSLCESRSGIVGSSYPACLAPKEIVSISFCYYSNISSYIHQYRRIYTERNIKRSQPPHPDRSKPVYCLSEKEPFLSKATVQCTDVRKGACILPNSKKPIEYKFDINTNKCRTEKPVGANSYSRQIRKSAKARFVPPTNKEHEDITPTIISHSPNNNSCKRTINISQPASRNSQYSNDVDKPEEPQNNEFRTNLFNSNPVVSRSRPSIPSNARGVICATAVETPFHVIPVNHSNTRIKAVNNESVQKHTTPVVHEGQEDFSTPEAEVTPAGTAVISKTELSQ